jgi:arylsulfatase A-like enzyme
MADKGKSFPNIVFIMADDMGYGDVGRYNPDSRIPTPAMDSLAEEGMIFTDAHSPSSVCTPTRYGVLTGRDCWRTPLSSQVLYNYEPPLIEAGRLTLASLLKAKGYHTACIGKWHLGLGWGVRKGERFDFRKALPWPGGSPDPLEEDKIDFERPITGGPTSLGFDYFFGTSGACTAQPPYAFIEDDHMVENPTVRLTEPPYAARMGRMAPSWKFEEVDLVIAEKALGYLEQRAGDPDTPFFLFLNPSAPHEPALEQVVPDFMRGKSEAGPRGDLVALYDWIVGRIVSALGRLSLSDDTLLIVTSDNGALPGHSASIDGREPWDSFGHDSCGEWRGYKSHIWDGGHREPLLVRWPGKIEPRSMSSELVCLNDFMATCAALTGIALPEDAGEDSYDILPVLLGERPGEPVREALVAHSFFGVFSIRQGPWKLILETKGSGGFPPPRGTGPVSGSSGQLYHLERDPVEREDLFEARPEVVKRLTEILEKYRREGRSTGHTG